MIPPTIFLRSFLVWLDEGCNVVFLFLLSWFVEVPAPAEGNPHYTVSQVLSEARSNGSKTACLLCQWLTVVFGLWSKTPGYDHCTSAMEGVPVDETAG